MNQLNEVREGEGLIKHRSLLNKLLQLLHLLQVSGLEKGSLNTRLHNDRKGLHTRQITVNGLRLLLNLRLGKEVREDIVVNLQGLSPPCKHKDIEHKQCDQHPLQAHHRLKD